MTLFYRDPTISAAERRKGVETFLQTISERTGVSFVFDGSPSTNGRTVWLGSLDPADEHFEVLALGHGIHEMMHVTDTDVQVVREASRESGLVFALFNSFEDLRIDKAGAERFAGYRLWREELGRVLLEKNQISAAAPETISAGSAFVLWTLFTLFSDHGYSWAQQCLPGLEKRMRANLPDDLMERFHAEVLKARSLASSAEALALARSISAICSQVTHGREPALEATSKAGAAAGNAAVPDHQEGTAGRSPDRIPRYKNTGRPRRSKRTLTFLREVLFDRRVDRAIPGVLEQEQFWETPSPDRDAELAAASLDRDVPETKFWSDGPSDAAVMSGADEYREEFEKALEHTARLARLFSEVLKTEDDGFERRGCEGVELAPDWLNAMAARDPRLFAAPSAERNVSADVTILLDRSGSMGIGTMTRAKCIVAALISALRAVSGCSARAAVFPGPGQDDKVSLVAAADEPIGRSLQRIAPVTAYGSTPIVEALRWAAHSFRTSARDRLLIVITDGRFPAGLARTAEDEMNARGIELALMTIDTPNENIVRNTVFVSRTDDLETAMAQLLGRTRFCRSLQQS